MSLPSTLADSVGKQAEQLSSRLGGVGFVLLATIAWSLSGLFTRLLTIDVWTAIAWRSLFGGLFLLVPYIAMNRRNWLSGFAIGRIGLLLAICQVICQACTVGAFYFTAVANVTVIYATAPFIAAFLAWWLFGEVVKKRTVLAAIACLVGVAVIVSGSVSGGHLLGDSLALGMTISFAFVIVIPRMHPTLPMLPTTIVSALMAFMLFAPLSSPASVSGTDWAVLAVFGFTNFTLALFMFLLGARRIPSSEAALIGTLEIVLAPLWVWLAFAERPTHAAVVGGIIILAVVVTHTAMDVFSGRRLQGHR